MQSWKKKLIDWETWYHWERICPWAENTMKWKCNHQGWTKVLWQRPKTNSVLSDLCLSSTSESKFADSCCISDSSTGCDSWQGDSEKTVAGSTDRQTYSTSGKSAADNACKHTEHTLHINYHTYHYYTHASARQPSNKQTCQFYGPFPGTPGWAGALTKGRFTGTTTGFYESDVLPTTRPIMSKHHRKTQWSPLFYRHCISTQQCQSTGHPSRQTWVSRSSPLLSYPYILIHPPTMSSDYYYTQLIMFAHTPSHMTWCCCTLSAEMAEFLKWPYDDDTSVKQCVRF